MSKNASHSRPSLFHWLKRWGWGSVITLSLFALGLTVVNVVDAYPFWRALRRVRQLDEPSLRAIAAACTQHEKAGHQRLLGDEIPSEFRFLKPVRVSFYPGASDITLFSRDDFLYVFLRVSTNSENQDIVCAGGSYGEQRSQTLWERNPEFTRRLNPKGRLVTLEQIDMHSSREWIVRSDELLVIDRHHTVGSTDTINSRIPLSVDQRTEIESAISSIGPDIRGHAFDSGGCDGVTLHVSFTPDGNAGDDIILANTWREEVRPLINAIIRILGKDATSDLQETVEWLTQPGHRDQACVIKNTLKEYNDRINRVPLPWWRLWPRFERTPDN